MKYINMKSKYTWCYDKHGNAVKVEPPVNSDLKVIKSVRTITGSIPDNIGQLNIRAYNKKHKERHGKL